MLAWMVLVLVGLVLWYGRPVVRFWCFTRELKAALYCASFWKRGGSISYEQARALVDDVFSLQLRRGGNNNHVVGAESDNVKTLVERLIDARLAEDWIVLPDVAPQYQAAMLIVDTRNLPTLAHDLKRAHMLVKKFVASPTEPCTVEFEVYGISRDLLYAMVNAARETFCAKPRINIDVYTHRLMPCFRLWMTRGRVES